MSPDLVTRWALGVGRGVEAAKERRMCVVGVRETGRSGGRKEAQEAEGKRRIGE